MVHQNVWWQIDGFWHQSHAQERKQGKQICSSLCAALIMAHVYSNNEEAVILLLEAMKYWSMKLFGVRLKFLGGLVCDHSDAFIDAFGKVFPDSPQGQDHSHVVMKFNDQPGKRASAQQRKT
jgi:hypothetical protein